MKRNTKIAIGAGAGILGLIALYLYYTQAQAQGEGGGGAAGGGTTTTGAGAVDWCKILPTLPGCAAPEAGGGAGAGAPSGGGGGGFTYGGVTYASPTEAFSALMAKKGTFQSQAIAAGAAPPLPTNVYAQQYFADILASGTMMLPTYEISGKKVSGSLQAIPADIAAKLNPSQVIVGGPTGYGAAVTGVSSQGIVQTSAGGFYVGTGVQGGVLEAKKGQVFQCSRWVGLEAGGTPHREYYSC